MERDVYSDLKIEAMKKATDMYECMIVAKTDPTASIGGETLKSFKEFEEWGWFDRYPIDEEENKWVYTMVIAMTQYRHLRWKHEHPEAAKKTKWERVMGVAPRR